jgi:hypothetical protein
VAFLDHPPDRGDRREIASADPEHVEVAARCLGAQRGRLIRPAECDAVGMGEG